MLWLAALVLALVSLQISLYCTTLYLHRSLTHRALAVHPALAFFMRLQIWVTTGIIPREWVAVHRKHHRYPDQEGDPHSPQLKGLLKILTGNLYYYNREANNRETVARFAPDIRHDWLDRHVFCHGYAGLLLGLLLFVLVLGPLAGGLAFALQTAGYAVASAVINGIGHAVGHQPFDNTATNMQLVAWLVAGEGLHNNHHAYPTSARFSLQPGEYDPAWPMIRALTFLRLARPLHIAPPAYSCESAHIE